MRNIPVIRTARLAPALLALAVLAACAGPREPQSSGIDTPTLWSKLRGTAGTDLNVPLASSDQAPVEQTWWTHFGDPVLDGLITEVLKNNKTLAIARARVEEVRADRTLARSALFPQVSIAADALRGNQGYATNNQVITVREADLEATWEVDLFGRNQARAAEAGALLQSEEATRQGVTVGLLAEVARTYFDLRNYQRQLIITRKNLDSQKKTAELTHAQFEGALAGDFDVQRAEAQVSTTEAQIPALQAAYDTALNHLNVLLGHAPGERDSLVQDEPPELKPLDAQTLVAAPAAVLAARPDVRAAERRFAASLSAKRAAVAGLFPDISLLGLYGVQGSSLMAASNPWTLGISLAQPVLNFGRVRSQIDAADARQQQAFLGYQETVLEALENMENALSGYLNETARNAALNKSVAQTRRAAVLARNQYENGYTGLLDVLTADRDVLNAEAALADSDAKLRKDLVNTYTAAGGGWDVPGAQDAH